MADRIPLPRPRPVQPQDLQPQTPYPNDQATQDALRQALAQTGQGSDRQSQALAQLLLGQLIPDFAVPANDLHQAFTLPYTGTSPGDTWLHAWTASKTARPPLEIAAQRSMYHRGENI